MDRRPRRLLAGLTLLLALLVAAPAAQAGHRFLPSSTLPGKLQRPTAASQFAAKALRAPALATPGLTIGVPAGAETGPCTETAKQGMPDGAPHDHRDPAQHAFECRLREAAFLPLRDELEGEDVVFGEMDVKADVAAVSVTYPTAGAVFFDVADPANPRFLSFYKGRQCEQTVLAVNCGAFVDLSAGAERAYIGVQTIGVEPIPDPGAPAKATPGVDVVDLSDRESPALVQTVPVEPVTLDLVAGSHTARSHVIPEGEEGDGRAPGEYVFAVENFNGLAIHEVTETSPATPVNPVPVASIPLDDIHDMFLKDDELDGRTYLYVAAGFKSGFYVFDVTDPANPVLKAEWDLTPECEDDWYAHTIDVAFRNGRRYVTMPAELFESGTQDAEDTDEGCGTVGGNGDQVGPLWIVDATDFDALPPTGSNATSDGGESDPGDVEVAALKLNSEEALVTTWTNPAGRAGGTFTFSPHNQQIVGNTIVLSHYHGGVFVLDATKAFSGTAFGPAARPTEIGFTTPNGGIRPIPGATGDEFDQGGDGFTEGLNQGEIWDAYGYKGHVFAADMIGGFYSLKLDESASSPAAGGTGAAASADGPAATPAPVTAGSGAPAACSVRTGFRSVRVRTRGRRAALAFSRAVNAPVTVDVFQQSQGRRVLGERLVARFTRRSGDVAWDGRANRRGRRVGDGTYLVRYSIPVPGGRDVRRVILRRSKGRFSVRPASELREGCGILASFKLERPVFGGRSNRANGVSYRLTRAARVRVQVLRAGRVVRETRLERRAAGRTVRLRVPSERLRRGDHRFRITVDPSTGRTVTATLTATRL